MFIMDFITTAAKILLKDSIFSKNTLTDLDNVISRIYPKLRTSHIRSVVHPYK